MKQVKIRRVSTSAEGTFGKLFVDGKFLCVTGELPRKAGNPQIENEIRTDCIPAGKYLCRIRKSPKFGKSYEVTNVPGRTYIMIHKGNWCGERPKWKSDVDGCIILGEKHGYLDHQKAVLSSTPAYKRFMETMEGKDFELTIEWA